MMRRRRFYPHLKAVKKQLKNDRNRTDHGLGLRPFSQRSRFRAVGTLPFPKITSFGTAGNTWFHICPLVAAPTTGLALMVVHDQNQCMRIETRSLRGWLMAGVAFFAVHVFGQQNGGWSSREVARHKAPEAKQGVAVDDAFFYAIANREIAKYRKSDGARVDYWKDVEGGRFIHLNAGVVRNGRLYVAHSNYPKVPMISSVEIWDTKSLQLTDTMDLGQTQGSLTWVDSCDGKWYAGFAHYARKGGMPEHGPEQTKVAQLDRKWHLLREWTFPRTLTDRFAPNSCSCAGFGPRGFLYATGHDAREIYVLQIPGVGSVLQWIATVPVSFEGQGFAWDPGSKEVVYGISRKTQEVVAVEILVPPSVSAH